jgi:hypothetical protein
MSNNNNEKNDTSISCSKIVHGLLGSELIKYSGIFNMNKPIGWVSFMEKVFMIVRDFRKNNTPETILSFLEQPLKIYIEKEGIEIKKKN